MIEREVQIVNSLGLHARPAGQIVRTAGAFQSHVELLKDGVAVNGKSILGVMMLAAEQGSTITLRADGSDEAEAVDALARLVAEGFGED
ncbi:MAG: HPr family phosphocarrier protein [Gemmatimonadota bacterium]|jgi:phosphocarrier protein|nr:HPr family phosphocarrier protein [Gemmatimonadota bacterium]